MKKVVIGSFILLILTYIFTIYIDIEVLSEDIKVFNEKELSVSSCLKDMFGFCLAKLPVNINESIDINKIGSY